MLMEDKGHIEIRVTGKIGNEPLSPDNYDIREIRALFDVIEAIVNSSQKIRKTPITYSISEGSVRNLFKTTRQSAVAFMAIMSMIQTSGSLDGLELPAARAISEIQKAAVKNNFKYEFLGDDMERPALTITKETSYRINEELWAEAELYLYGTLTNAGGKDKSNIHLLTENNGILIINTEKEVLQSREENMLYKNYMVRAKGRQNIRSGELDMGSLELLEMKQYDPSYSEQYLASLIKKATPKWQGIDDVDEWVGKMRGING